MNKSKDLIDDGFNAELVEEALFDGLLEIPTIKKPETFIIPKVLRPFSQRNNKPDYSDFIMEYEHDIRFRDLLTCTKNCLPEISKYAGFISPDNSLYFDMPLALQITNVYLNRQIGYFIQQQGVYVIPNIRWGDERTYKRILPNERPIAFLGAEKHSIYSIGTYGCCRSAKEKYHLREGLRSMIIELEPVIILVYGPIPDSIFGEFKNQNIQFVHYDDWIKVQHQKGGKLNG